MSFMVISGMQLFKIGITLNWKVQESFSQSISLKNVHILWLRSKFDRKCLNKLNWGGYCLLKTRQASEVHNSVVSERKSFLFDFQVTNSSNFSLKVFWLESVHFIRKQNNLLRGVRDYVLYGRIFLAPQLIIFNLWSIFSLTTRLPWLILSFDIFFTTLTKFFSKIGTVRI